MQHNADTISPATGETTPYATPFLKWAGGKSSLIRQFEKKSLFPQRTCRRYFEPFVGGGAVFFHLRGKHSANRYYLSDINRELINIYRVVRDDLPALIDELRVHQMNHSDDYYYLVRKRDRNGKWPGGYSAVERAARMVYLNRTCFNGLWRVNNDGQFNVPVGSYRRPRILDEPGLRAAAAALDGVSVREVNFAEAVEGAGPGDFVYFDPPYVPLTATANFTSYTRDGFGPAQQEALAETFRALDDRGCRVMLSNSDVPVIRELYDGYRIETVQARRAINSRGDGRGPVNEVVVLNY